MGRKQKNNNSKKMSRSSTNSETDDPPRRSKRNKKGRNYQQLPENSNEDYHLRERLQASGKHTIIDMEADGNCLFRAISDQLYYDFGNSHADVRLDVCDYLEAFEDFFSNFLILDDEDQDDEDYTKDFETYVYNMRQDSEWGGNLELVAAARLYQRNITLYQYGAALTFEPGDNLRPNGPPLLLSYHENEHYNSVRDSSISRPPAPVKSFESFARQETTPTSMSSSTEEEGSDISVEEKEPPQRVTKNSPCPCGSGLKYKKCCWAKEKRKQHARKVHLNTASSDDEDGGGASDPDDGPPTGDGDFKVLKI